MQVRHAEIYKDQIEAYADNFWRYNKLVRCAQEGKLGKQCYSRYIQNLCLLFRENYRSIQLAADRSKSTGKQGLVDYYLEKLQEEKGHDKWAESDLEAIHGKKVNFAEELINPSTYKLIAYSRSLIEEGAESFLIYMLALEYFTVVAGDRWVQLLTKSCGITPKQVSSISNHVEADVHHAVEDFAVINKYISAADVDRAGMQLRCVLEHMDSLFNECVELTESHLV